MFQQIVVLSKLKELFTGIASHPLRLELSVGTLLFKKEVERARGPSGSESFERRCLV